jgi:RNA polymerase sigma-70 factor (ECF subfamily)
MAPEQPLDVTEIHDEHADFVWASLQRLGVLDDDLEDVLQEVFVVVHRRLSTFDGTSLMTTWLFGICIRVVTAYRRRAYRRRERPVPAMPFEPESAPRDGPDARHDAVQAQAVLSALLDELDLDKRAVFVMFEIEEMPCDQIAQTLGVPTGTVYSRLHAARKMFEAALARHHARERRMGVTP